MKYLIVVFLFANANNFFAQKVEYFAAANSTHLVTYTNDNFQELKQQSNIGLQIGAAINFSYSNFHVLIPRNLEISYNYFRGDYNGGFISLGGFALHDINYARHGLMVSSLLARRKLSFVNVGFGIWTKANLYSQFEGNFRFSNPKDFGEKDVNETGINNRKINIGLNMNTTIDLYNGPKYRVALFYQVAASILDEFVTSGSSKLLQHSVGLRYCVKTRTELPSVL